MPSLTDLYSYAPDETMAMAMPYTSMYRPDLPRPLQGVNRRSFGPRHDFASGAKGYGWLGPMQAMSGNPMTEYSLTNPVTGRDYPQVVPTLTAEELQYLLTEPNGIPSIPTKNRIVDAGMYNKASKWAKLRGLQGLSPFID